MRGRTVCGRPVAILVFAKPRHEEVGGPFSIAFSAKWNRLRATSTRRPLRTKCRPQSCCIYRRTTSWTFKQTVVGYEHAMGDVLSFGRHSGQSYEDGCLERRQLWQTREEPGPSQAIQTKLRNGVNRHTDTRFQPLLALGRHIGWATQVGPVVPGWSRLRGKAQAAGMSHHAVSVAKQERQRKVPRLRCCTKVTHTCQWMEPIDICVHDSNLYSMGQDIAGTNFSAMGMPPWTRSGAIREYRDLILAMHHDERRHSKPESIRCLFYFGGPLCRLWMF